MFDPITIQTMLSDGWTESNPTVSGVLFSIDEFDPNWLMPVDAASPAQILVETVASNENWVIDTVYKKIQAIRITAYLKPTSNNPTLLLDAKTTFYNILDEIDRIIIANRYDGSTTYDKASWTTISVPHGRAVLPVGEEELFMAILDVGVTYY